MAKDNPFTQLPGYVVGRYGEPNGWFVVFDREQIEAYSPDRANNRWLVKCMAAGRSRSFATKQAASIEATRLGKSVRPSDFWWKES